MATELANAAYSLLASGIDADDTSLSVTSGHGARFPSSNFYVCVYDSIYPNYAVAYRASAGEIMLCSSRSTDTLTVTRAQAGTSAIAHNTTGRTYRIELNFLKEHLDEIADQAISQLPIAFQAGFGTSVTRYVIPAYYNVESDDGDMRYYPGRACTVKSFTIVGRPVLAPAQDYTHTFTLRKSGVDTAMTGSITVTNAGGIGYYKMTTSGNEITFTADEWMDIKCVMAANTFINFSGNVTVSF